MAYLMFDNTNLAYDLSRFDTSEREQREKQRRADEEARKIRIAPAQSVSRSGSRFKVVFSALMIFAALFSVNYFNAKNDDVSRMVAKQEQQLSAAKDDNELLQSKLDTKANIAYIEKYATENLGMSKVTASQKKYLSVNTEDLIVAEGDDSEGFLGAVQKWFGSILEYIGF